MPENEGSLVLKVLIELPDVLRRLKSGYYELQTVVERDDFRITESPDLPLSRFRSDVMAIVQFLLPGYDAEALIGMHVRGFGEELFDKFEAGAFYDLDYLSEAYEDLSKTLALDFGVSLQQFNYLEDK